MKFDLTIEASTIINDVSTIDSIGQFSIAIGNLIKGDSGKSPYIDETTKTWWEYNDTSKEYEDTGIAAKSVDVYNITNEIPLGAELFYTLSTAITATPIANRKKGLLLMFESRAGVWETYQFKGVIANWSVLGSWSNDLSLKIDKTAITQESGASETDVMSQKAVTDEIAQLAGDLNTYGVLGIEGINKLNPKNYLQDVYIYSNGGVEGAEGWKTSDYQNIYDVVSFRNVTNTPYAIPYIAQYNSNKIFIPGSYQTNASTINKFNGSAFYRISTTTDLDKVMAVDGAIDGIEFYKYSLIVEKNKEGTNAVFKPNLEDIELKSLTLDENTKLRLWLLGECFVIDSDAIYNPDGSLKSANIIYPDLKTGTITINRNFSGAAISIMASYNGKNATYTINRDSGNKVINTSITIS